MNGGDLIRASIRAYARGNMDQSRIHAQEAQQRLSQLGDRAGFRMRWALADWFLRTRSPADAVDQCQAALQKARRLIPDRLPQARCHLALAHLHRGDIQAALDTIRNEISLPARAIRAEALARAGDASALAELAHLRARMRYPQNAEWTLRLADLYLPHNPAEAQRLLASLRAPYYPPRVARARALLCARLALLTLDATAALLHLESALLRWKSDPIACDLLELLAKAQLDAGRPLLAQKALEQSRALCLWPHSLAQNDLAFSRLYAHSAMPDLAQKRISAILAKTHRDAVAQQKPVDRVFETRLYMELATLRAKESLADGIDAMRRALASARLSGNPADIRTAHFALARLYAELGAYPRGLLHMDAIAAGKAALTYDEAMLRGDLYAAGAENAAAAAQYWAAYLACEAPGDAADMLSALESAYRADPSPDEDALYRIHAAVMRLVDNREIDDAHLPQATQLLARMDRRASMQKLAERYQSGLESPLEITRWRLSMASVKHFLQGDAEGAERIFETEVREAENRDDPVALTLALYRQAEALIQAQAFGRAIALLTRSLRIDKELGNLGDQAVTHGMLALAYQRDDQNTKAIQHHREALSLYARVGSVPGMLETLGLLAACLMDEADMDGALKAAESGVRIAREAGLAREEADMIQNKAAVLLHERRGADARGAFETAQRLRETYGRLPEMAAGCLDMAQTALEAGDAQYALELARRAEGMQRRIGNRVRESAAQKLGSLALGRLGRTDEALEALALSARGLPAAYVQRQAYDDGMQRANLQAHAGRFKDAARTYRELLENREGLEPARLAGALYMLGETYIALDRYDQAEAVLGECAQVCRESGIWQSACVAMRSMAVAQRNRSLHESARTLEAALALVREHDLPMEAQLCIELSRAYLSLDEEDMAQGYAQRAEAIAREKGQTSALGFAKHMQAGIAVWEKAYGRAFELYQEALGIRERAKDARAVGVTLYEMGNLWAVQGQPRRALWYFQRSLDVQEREGDVLGRIPCLREMGTSYRNMGEVETAQGYYQRALDAAMGSDQPMHVARVLKEIGELKAETGDMDGALAEFEKIPEVFREGKLEEHEGASNHQLGVVYRQCGYPDKAMACFEKALGIYEGRGDWREMNRVLLDVASLHKAMGRGRLAEEALRRTILEGGVSEGDGEGEARERLTEGYTPHLRLVQKGPEE